MTLWVKWTSLETRVLDDLRKMCPDPAMGIDFQSPGDPDRFHSGRISYSQQTMQTPGCDLLFFLAGHNSHVCLFGEPDDYWAIPPNLGNLEEGRPLSVFQGITWFDRKHPLPNWVNVLYDPTDGGGRGYYVIGADGERMASPSYTILFHELCHAREIVKGLFDQANTESTAIFLENKYRKSIGLPPRVGEGGGVGWHPEPASKKSDPPRASKSNCFIATAAFGSPAAPEVEFLRRFRDDVLRRTASGRAFFADYWSAYYTVSPSIAAMMDADARLREIMRWSVVEPLVAFFRETIEMPDAPLHDVPEPWRAYLEGRRSQLEKWTQVITPPYDFTGYSAGEVVAELAVVLRYLFRTPESRSIYLSRLTDLGHLPLRLQGRQRMLHSETLARSGRTPREVTAILGPASAADDSPTVLGAVTNRGLQNMAEVSPNGATYTVQIRNQTVVTFDEVLLFYRQRGRQGVVVLREAMVKPGQVVIFALTLAANMESYTVGFFAGNNLVARIPANGGVMTAQRAASLDPDRVDAWSDAWVILATTLLSTGGVMYQVAVNNATTEVLDVTLFFTQAGQSEQGLERKDLQPGDTVTFQLCPCDKLVGYVFRAWINGERIVTQPPTGLMNARRAAELKLGDDLDPCGDVWRIAAD